MRVEDVDIEDLRYWLEENCKECNTNGCTERALDEHLHVIEDPYCTMIEIDEANSVSGKYEFFLL